MGSLSNGYPVSVFDEPESFVIGNSDAESTIMKINKNVTWTSISTLVPWTVLFGPRKKDNLIK